MKSGSWVSAPAMLAEHGAPGCGTAGSAAPRGDATSVAAAETATAATPTIIRFMIDRYTLLRSVRINVTW